MDRSKLGAWRPCTCSLLLPPAASTDARRLCQCAVGVRDSRICAGAQGEKAEPCLQGSRGLQGLCEGWQEERRACRAGHC